MWLFNIISYDKLLLLFLDALFDEKWDILNITLDNCLLQDTNCPNLFFNMQLIDKTVK